MLIAQFIECPHQDLVGSSLNLGTVIMFHNCCESITCIFFLTSTALHNHFVVIFQCIKISFFFASVSLWQFFFFHRTYGEAVFLAAQTTSIAVMVLIYSNKLMHGVMYMSIYVGAMGFLLSPAVPSDVLSFLQASNLIIVVLGKVSFMSSNSLIKLKHVSIPHGLRF